MYTQAFFPFIRSKISSKLLLFWGLSSETISSHHLWECFMRCQQLWGEIAWFVTSTQATVCYTLTALSFITITGLLNKLWLCGSSQRKLSSRDTWPEHPFIFHTGEICHVTSSRPATPVGPRSLQWCNEEGLYGIDPGLAPLIRLHGWEKHV